MEKERRYYVYLLMDPSKKGMESIFYVGHGCKKRAADHLKEKKESKKRSKIEEIKRKNKEVKTTILRHELTKQEAIEVEASVIELIGKNNLTNVQTGHHTKEKGMIDYATLTSKGDLKKEDWKKLGKEGCLLVNIKNSYSIYLRPEELYKATRGNWKLAEKNIKGIKYVLAYYEGVIQEIYEVKRWQEIKKGKEKGRWYFDGTITAEKMRKKYYKKNISNYINKGPWAFSYVPHGIK